MSVKSSTAFRVLLIAAGLSVVPSPVSSYPEDPGPVAYYLYEDAFGRPWCGGARCDSGLCCTIGTVIITPTSSNEEFDLES
jgi:hypothetical protein